MIIQPNGLMSYWQVVKNAYSSPERDGLRILRFWLRVFCATCLDHRWNESDKQPLSARKKDPLLAMWYCIHFRGLLFDLVADFRLLSGAL